MASTDVGNRSVPVLLQILSGTPANQLMPQKSIYTLEANKSVELTIPGGVLAGRKLGSLLVLYTWFNIIISPPGASARSCLLRRALGR